jgi:hypothetical protein
MNIAEIMPACLFHTIFSSDRLVMLIALVTRDIRHINKIFKAVRKKHKHFYITSYMQHPTWQENRQKYVLIAWASGTVGLAKQYMTWISTDAMMSINRCIHTIMTNLVTPNQFHHISTPSKQKGLSVFLIWLSPNISDTQLLVFNRFNDPKTGPK